MENAGMIKLSENHTFLWMLSGDGDEIHGMVETFEDGNRVILERHSGWYRTDDPDVAAQIAKTNLEYELDMK